MGYVRLFLAFGPAALVLATGTDSAHAQAWLPDQGILGGDVLYQFDTADKIIEDGGDIELEGSDTTIQSVVIGLEYSPLARLAVSARVPIVAARFSGEVSDDGQSLFPHGEWDDGDTHIGLTDFRFDVRYAVLQEIVALTPQVGVSIPMSDYPVVGFTAAGRGLKQVHLGLNVGRTFRPFLPSLYVHGMYEFSLVEKADLDPDLEEFSQNKSRFGVQLGYFILPQLQANVSFDGALNHGGIAFVDFADYSAAVQNYHDVVLKEKAMLIGGGVSYQLTDMLGIGVAYRQFISGDNTRNPRIFGATLTWELPVGPTPSDNFGDDDEDEGEVAHAK
jgi:hypothetical protein